SNRELDAVAGQAAVARRSQGPVAAGPGRALHGYRRAREFLVGYQASVLVARRMALDAHGDAMRDVSPAFGMARRNVRGRRELCLRRALPIFCLREGPLAPPHAERCE